MSDRDAITKLVEKLRDYARGRASDVSRGAETPYLAALLLQKYGRGVIDAATVIFDDQRAGDLVQTVLDEETFTIDPEWREHDRQRWALRPADVLGAP